MKTRLIAGLALLFAVTALAAPVPPYYPTMTNRPSAGQVPIADSAAVGHWGAGGGGGGGVTNNQVLPGWPSWPNWFSHASTSGGLVMGNDSSGNLVDGPLQWSDSPTYSVSIGSPYWFAGNGSGLTNVAASALSSGALLTNILGTGGFTDTNYLTGSYTKYAGGYLISSNGATGSIRVETNGSITISNGVTGAVASMTNGSFYGNGSGLTNLSAAATIIPVQTYYGAGMLSANDARNDAIYAYASIDFITNANFTVTNIYTALGSTNATPANVLMNVYWSATTNYFVATNPPGTVHLLYSTNLTTPTWAGSVPNNVGGNLHNIPIYGGFVPPVSNYLWVTFSAKPQVVGLVMPYWYGGANGNLYWTNTGWCMAATSAGGTLYGQTPTTSYANVPCELSGYGYQTAAASASQVAYSHNLSGFNTITVQGALDTLAYQAVTSSVPLAASNTVLICEGDSSGNRLGQYAIISTDPWMSSLALRTNVAMGGSGYFQYAGGSGPYGVVSNWNTFEALMVSNYVANGKQPVIWLKDGINDQSYTNPYAEITAISNYVAQVNSSNALVVGFTMNPSGMNDNNATVVNYNLVVNNWIRNSPLFWRVVDAAAIISDLYDTNFAIWNPGAGDYYIHETPYAATIEVQEALRQMFSSQKSVAAQRWIAGYGTNIFLAVPGNTNAYTGANSAANGGLLAGWNIGGLQVLTNALTNWPTTLLSPGAVALVNSNGFPYWLSAGPNGTSVAQTNQAFTSGWQRQVFAGKYYNTAISTGQKYVPLEGSSSTLLTTSGGAMGPCPTNGYLTNLSVYGSILWPNTTNVVFGPYTNALGVTAVASGLSIALQGGTGIQWTNSGTGSVSLFGTAGQGWGMGLNVTSPGGNLPAQTLSWTVEWWHQ